MFTLRPLSRYRRNLKKLIQKDRALAERVRRVLIRLATDPRDPSLRSHKVTADDGATAFSSEITGDLRLIWRYAEDEVDIIDLVNIGGHSGAKKVYQ